MTMKKEQDEAAPLGGESGEMFTHAVYNLKTAMEYIEVQGKENAKLKRQVECLIHNWQDSDKVADRRLHKLETALKSIADNSCCAPCREAALVAKKALSYSTPSPTSSSKAILDDSTASENKTKENPD